MDIKRVGGKDIITISITNSMIEIAEYLADQMGDLYNYDGTREPLGAYYGKLAEVGVEQMFYNLDKWYETDLFFPRKGADKGDFIVLNNRGEKRIIDVKSGSHLGHSHLLKPIEQPNYEYYIGTRLNRDKERGIPPTQVEIWGWCRHQDLGKVKPHTPIKSIGRPLTQLNSITSLLNQMQDGSHAD